MSLNKTNKFVRVALVNPYYQNRTRSIAQITIGPPLGLGYIAAVLEREGFDVAIIDANAQRLAPQDVAKHILEFRTDILGLSAVTPTIHMCHQIARLLKKQNNSVLTVVGGVHATVLPEETLREFFHFDFLIRGEGEFVFVDLLRALNNNANLNGVKGLCYRQQDSIVINEQQENIKNLDELPFPARHLLKSKLYRTFDSGLMTSVIAMRGCTAKCIYCAVNQVAGSRCRKRGPENVIKEIITCYFEYNTRFIAFLDDTFTFDKAWVHQLCDEFIRVGLNRKVKWSCLTRVDNVDSSLLLHMKKSGCIRLEFGIESGSCNLLEYLKKGITTVQVREVFSIAKKLNLSTMGFIMLNVPGETRATIAETKKLVMEVDPDFLQVSFATPYPGTELFRDCIKDGLVTTKDWSQYIFLNNQIIKNKDITEGELRKLKRDIEESFYLRPRYLLRILLYMLKNPASIKTMIWAGLNAFRRLLSER